MFRAEAPGRVRKIKDGSVALVFHFQTAAIAELL